MMSRSPRRHRQRNAGDFFQGSKDYDMGIGNGAPAWPSVIVSNGGISPSDHTTVSTALPAAS